jgi:hypothetical protein
LVVHFLGSEAIDVLGGEHQGAILGHQSSELARKVADLARRPVAGLIHLGGAAVGVALVSGSANLRAFIGMVLRRAGASQVGIVVTA